jgi:hypothetical protein
MARGMRMRSRTTISRGCDVVTAKKVSVVNRR